ncbi:hypothetical protein [Pseudonocardia lacus]|uniref:hypothetical protein n=1 Tax=Pseudonocardia lacus TaxID=2835865 RepID=UPI001BDC25BF|nr:hypothetical protein [Pseudonocardia lacus]
MTPQDRWSTTAPPTRKMAGARGWVHDTGYEPALQHAGFPLAVLTDGQVTKGPLELLPVQRVVGWSAGCTCGWQSPRTYKRADHPSPTGEPPLAVEGSTTRTGTFSEWRFHLFSAVPELAVADAVNVALRPRGGVLTHPVVAAVVAAVRGRGVQWNKIADAAGVTLREAKWAWAQPATRRKSSARRQSPARRAARFDAAPHHPATRSTAGRDGMGAAPGT